MYSELYLHNKKAFYEDFEKIIESVDETIDKTKEKQ